MLVRSRRLFVFPFEFPRSPLSSEPSFLKGEETEINRVNIIIYDYMGGSYTIDQRVERENLSLRGR